MRKICVLSFVSLDGVMQAPGGPEEDDTSRFRHGGWTVGYFDDVLVQEMNRQMGQEFDLLLGRRTYDIFASHWPQATGPVADSINNATKYVVTSRPLAADWNRTALRLESDLVGSLRNLKRSKGRELQVHGSAKLVQTLLEHDLVDELWLKIFPVTLGSGCKLFGEGTSLAGFALLESSASPSGVLIARYARAGEVKFGSFQRAK